MESGRRMRSKVISSLRIVTISSVLGLLLSQTGKPQRVTDPPRVGFEFRCPTYTVARCQSMTLQADVFGAKEVLGEERAKLIGYRWEISGGKILVGQGTAKVTIEASDVPSGTLGSIDVKVILDGGPPELEKEKSCTLKVDPKCDRLILFGQYEDISLKDEQQRLDRLGRYLTSERSGSIAFLVAYAGQSSCLWEAELRANRAKKYLVDSHRVEASRIIAIDGGFRDKLTVDLFTSAHDSCGPFPTPSLVGSRAHIEGSCTDKYRETINQ